MSDIREKLKPLVNKRVQVRGTFTKWDCNWKTGLRQTGRACVINPEIDAEVVCEHVWVVDAPHWKEYQQASGSQVVFDAVVQKYTDRTTGQTNYCLGSASDPKFIHQPPALVIPDPPKEVEMVKNYSEVSASVEEEPVEEKETVKESAPDTTEDTPMDKIRQVKVFAKACGSLAKAETALAALPQMPLPEVMAYIRVLKE